MTFSKDDLIATLRLRYDSYSAEAVYEMARQRAELDDTPTLDASQLARFRTALEAVGDRVQVPLAHIDAMLESAPAGSGKAAADKSAKDAKADKPEAKDVKDDKPAAKADKGDAKAEAKDAKDAKADADEGDAKAAAKETQDAKADADKGDAKAEAKDAKPIETTIVLTGIKLGDGEQVMVCGGAKTLGDWDPKHARAMKRDGDRYQVTVELSASAETSYKFVRRTADGKMIWESGEDRRLVAAPRVEVTWQQA